jgi:hypothetical protein
MYLKKSHYNKVRTSNNGGSNRSAYVGVKVVAIDDFARKTLNETNGIVDPYGHI